MTDKEILAKNLKKYMALHNKSRNDVCQALGFNYYTFTDWVNAKKMPRMDKITKLANYFGIQKSDLIEEKMTPEIEKDNEDIANFIVRLRTDKEFYSIVHALYDLDSDKIKGIRSMLDALAK